MHPSRGTRLAPTNPASADTVHKETSDPTTAHGCTCPLASSSSQATQFLPALVAWSRGRSCSLRQAARLSAPDRSNIMQLAAHATKCNAVDRAVLRRFGSALADINASSCRVIYQDSNNPCLPKLWRHYIVYVSIVCVWCWKSLPTTVQFADCLPSPTD